MKQVTDYIYSPQLRYGWAGSREELIEAIDEMLSRVPENQRAGARIEIDTANEWDVNYTEVKVAFTRPQTKEEAKAEAVEEEARLKWKKQYFERLKKELGE